PPPSARRQRGHHQAGDARRRDGQHDRGRDVKHPGGRHAVISVPAAWATFFPAALFPAALFPAARAGQYASASSASSGPELTSVAPPARMVPNASPKTQITRAITMASSSVALAPGGGR